MNVNSTGGDIGMIVDRRPRRGEDDGAPFGVRGELRGSVGARLILISVVLSAVFIQG